VTPERWHQVRELLASAMQLDPGRRPAYLDHSCGADSDLRNQLNELLIAEEEVRTDFLESLPHAESVLVRLKAFTVPGYQFQIQNKSLIGCRVGSYQIVEEIGSGGMGEVYRAFRADDQYRQQVAVKVVRQDRNSDAVIERFRNERQILADLDHPNIARILDGGTAEAGDPFFVMELIDGLPIDEYCDRRALSITERLQLFCLVCSAVEYAHRHLIVHRDIKPGNILVTADGVAKLLDFGIAKILDAPSIDGRAQAKTAMLRPLTPGYASPEQITGVTITTASDVYSLGVVLYELLTGRSPYRLGTRIPPGTVRAVCEIEPEKLSLVVCRDEPTGKENGPGANDSAAIAAARQSSPEKLSKRLTGDLDNIVLMALRKEPQRRYVSVQQFAQDIQRHLTSLPVIARRDTLGYRTAKFVNRNRAGVLAVGLIVITVLTALVLLIRANRIARQQSEMAREERARAERRFNDLRSLANSMIFDLPRPIHALPGSVAVEKMIFDRGLKYLDSLAAEAGSDVTLQRELAAGYKQLGDSMGSPYGSNVGDQAGALANYRKALKIRETIAGNTGSNLQDRFDLAKTYRTLGALLVRTGDLSAARDCVHKAIAMMQAIAEAHGDDHMVLNELSVDYLTQGFIDEEGLENGPAEQPAIALADYLKSYELVERIVHLRPDLIAYQNQAVYMLGWIAREYSEVGNPAKAIEYSREGLRRADKSKATEPADKVWHLSVVAGIHSMIGDELVLSGRPEEALPEYKKETAGFKALFDATDYPSRFDLADGEVNQGHALELAGDAATGLREIEKGIGLMEQVEGAISTDHTTADHRAMYYLYEGEAFEHLGKLQEALDAYQKVIYQSHLPALAVFPRTKLLTAAGLASLARVLARLGNSAEARRRYKEALSLAEPAATSKPPSPSAQYILTDVYAGLGNLSLRTGSSGARTLDHGTETCRWYQMSADRWKQLPTQHSLAPNGFKVTDFSTVPRQLVMCNK
jgi:serine/threonine protein kinase/tetratricopeptide (TPR) repeat protein